MHKISFIALIQLALLFFAGCAKVNAPNYTIQFNATNKEGLYVYKDINKSINILKEYKEVFNPCVSPNREMLLFSSLDSNGITQLYLMNYNSQQPKVISFFKKQFVMTGGHFVPEYSWSPDSKEIVYYCSEGIYIYNIASAIANEIPFITSKNEDLFSLGGPLWSPVGYNIIFAPIYDVYLYNVEAKKWTKITNRLKPISNNLCWSPTGDEIIYGQNDTVYIYNINTKLEKPIIKDQSVMEITWAKNGKEIFYLYFPNATCSNIYSMDLINNSTQQLTNNNSFDGSFINVNDSIIIYESLREKKWKLFELNIINKRSKEILTGVEEPRFPQIVKW